MASPADAPPIDPAALIPLVKPFIGAIEVGVLGSVCLYGIMLVQMYNFVTAATSESRNLKLLVLWVFLLETAHTALVCFYIYDATITNFGSPIAILVPSHEFSVAVALSGLIGASVQSFFAYRIVILSRNVVWGIPSWIGSLARIGLTAWLASFAIMSSSLIEFEETKKLQITTVLAVSLAVDVINTSVFCIFIALMRSDFAKTSHAMDKLILWTVETGLVSCACAVTIIALWFAQQYGWAYCLISIYGKLYSNSLMVSLNARASLRKNMSSYVSSSANRPVISSRFAPPETFDVELHQTPYPTRQPTWGGDPVGSSVPAFESKVHDGEDGSAMDA